MKNWFGMLAGAALLCGMPSAAQAQERNKDTASAGESDLTLADLDLFPVEVEPLTAEQEARLPTARRVAMQLMPEGSFRYAMSEYLDIMLETFLADETGGERGALIELTGLPAWRVNDLDDSQVSAALAIIDPNRAPREEALLEVMVETLDQMMTVMEPLYREGMAKAYAVEYTQEELEGFEAFFATPLGKRFASRQAAMEASPHIVSAMNEMLPVMMELFEPMAVRISAIEEQYGVGRTVSALDPAEFAALAKALGISDQDLLAASTDLGED